LLGYRPQSSRLANLYEHQLTEVYIAYLMPFVYALYSSLSERFQPDDSEASGPLWTVNKRSLKLASTAVSNYSIFILPFPNPHGFMTYDFKLTLLPTGYSDSTTSPAHELPNMQAPVTVSLSALRRSS